MPSDQRIISGPRFNGAAWPFSLMALIAGCSVYTDALLLPGTAGTGGSAGTGAEGHMQSDGGSSSQGGIDNLGATGATDVGGSAGTSSGATGVTAGMGGVPDGAGGEGGSPAVD